METDTFWRLARHAPDDAMVAGAWREDGDTVHLHIYMGRATVEATIISAPARIFGVNAPEHDKPGGAEATAFTQAWLAEHAAHLGNGTVANWPFLFLLMGPEAHGRALGALVCGQGHNLADDLISSGHGVAFTPKGLMGAAPK